MTKGKNGKVEEKAVAEVEAQTALDTGADPSPRLDPEVLAKIAKLRSSVRESFGNVTMAMMMLSRYRQQTLADLQHLLLEPLIRDRVAIAQRQDDSGLAEDVAGIAIWASLSDEAEGRLRDQIKGGTWPVRLRGEDWNSGNNNWLIDVIAPDQQAAARVIASFKQVVKEGELKLHPLIARLVDAGTLEKLGARKDGAVPASPVNAEGSAAVN